VTPECRHIKTNGEKCHAVSLRGKAYCYFHMRLHSTVAGARKPTKSKDRPIDFTFTDSPVAIQLGAYQVLSALGSLSISPHRAGQMLYALQVATQNVEHRSTDASERSVHCVTQSAEGEEMGPECSGGFVSDCGKCDKFETCDLIQRHKSGNAEDDGKPLPPLPVMLRDALMKNLSGLSHERYEKYKEFISPSKSTPDPLKSAVRLSSFLSQSDRRTIE
jgi:hypothetical protein